MDSQMDFRLSASSKLLMNLSVQVRKLERKVFRLKKRLDELKSKPKRRGHMAAKKKASKKAKPMKKK